MFINLQNKPKRNWEVPLKAVVSLLQPTQVEVNGAIVKKSEYKPFDIAGSLEPFKSRDFSITSLQSVGALNTLKTTYMSFTSSTNIADQFENITINVQETA